MTDKVTPTERDYAEHDFDFAATLLDQGIDDGETYKTLYERLQAMAALIAADRVEEREGPGLLCKIAAINHQRDALEIENARLRNALEECKTPLRETIFADEIKQTWHSRFWAINVIVSEALKGGDK